MHDREVRPTAMSDPARRRRLDSTTSDLLRRALGVGWALVMGWLFVAAGHDHRPAFTSRHECGTDPLDFLRIGEIVEKSTLRFIVEAHCENARYVSDERLELRYGGQTVEVETRKLTVGGAPHYEIVAIGGWNLD